MRSRDSDTTFSSAIDQSLILRQKSISAGHAFDRRIFYAVRPELVPVFSAVSLIEIADLLCCESLDVGVRGTVEKLAGTPVDSRIGAFEGCFGWLDT